MKSDIQKTVEIPSGVQVQIDSGRVTVKGPKGEDSRVFEHPKISISVADSTVLLESKAATRREKRMVGTFASHLANMVFGVQKPFLYVLKICSGHFPMNVSVSGSEFVIKNFLGEKYPRKISFDASKVSVKVAGDKVEVSSISREAAGTVAARIEQLCRLTKRDIRIFQDGVYIIEKPKRELSA